MHLLLHLQMVLSGNSCMSTHPSDNYLSKRHVQDCANPQISASWSRQLSSACDPVGHPLTRCCIPRYDKIWVSNPWSVCMTCSTSKLETAGDRTGCSEEVHQKVAAKLAACSKEISTPHCFTPASTARLVMTKASHFAKSLLLSQCSMHFRLACGLTSMKVSSSTSSFLGVPGCRRGPPPPPPPPPPPAVAAPDVLGILRRAWD